MPIKNLAVSGVLGICISITLISCRIVNTDEWGLKDIVDSYEDNLKVEELKKLSKAIEKNPENAALLFKRAKYYSFVSANKRALRDLDKAIKLDSNKVDYFQTRATVYSQMKQYKKALEDYSRAIKLDANVSFMFSDRGDCYKHLGEYEKAEKEYTRAIEVDKTPDSALVQRAKFYLERGRWEDAEKDLLAVQKLEELEDYWKILSTTELANAYVARGDFHKAVDLLDAVKFNSDNNSAYYFLSNRAYLKELLGIKDDAITDYKLALAFLNKMISEEKEPSPVYLKSRYLLRKKLDKRFDKDRDLEQLVKAYDKQFSSQKIGVNIDPFSSKVRALKSPGRENKYKSEKDNLLKMYQKQIDFDSKIASKYRDRAFFFESIKDYQNALSDYEKASQLAPDETRYKVFAISVLHKLNQVEEALTRTDKLYRQEPEDPKVMKLKAMALIKRKDYQSALELLNKVRTSSLDDYKFYELLKEVYEALGDKEKARKNSIISKYFKSEYSTFP